MENIEFGHWHNIEKQIKEDDPLTRLSEYHGQETFRLAITQIGTSVKHQEQVVNEWCDFFRHELTSIKNIFFTTRVSQKIFDAICTQQQLEGLWIKWGVYPNVKSLQNLHNLKYLHLGGGASIDDISVIKSMKELIALELSHLFKISNYDFLTGLTKLIDLLIEGDPYASMKKVKIESLQFLENMPQIVRLSLSMTSIVDRSYLPILKIKALKYLDLPRDKDLQKDIHLFKNFFT